jgi:hypothetical protein
MRKMPGFAVPRRFPEILSALGWEIVFLFMGSRPILGRRSPNLIEHSLRDSSFPRVAQNRRGIRKRKSKENFGDSVSGNRGFHGSLRGEVI